MIFPSLPAIRRKRNPFPITPQQKEALQRWVRAHHTPQSVAARCRIVLMVADGVSNNQIAKQLTITRPTVLLWRQHFAKLGQAGLTEIQKGRGGRLTIGPEKVQSIVHMTLHTQPKGATHWSCQPWLETAASVPPPFNGFGTPTGCNPVGSAAWTENFLNRTSI